MSRRRPFNAQKEQKYSKDFEFSIWMNSQFHSTEKTKGGRFGPQKVFLVLFSQELSVSSDIVCLFLTLEENETSELLRFEPWPPHK